MAQAHTDETLAWVMVIHHQQQNAPRAHL